MLRGRCLYHKHQEDSRRLHVEQTSSTSSHEFMVRMFGGAICPRRGLQDVSACGAHYSHGESATRTQCHWQHVNLQGECLAGWLSRPFQGTTSCPRVQLASKSRLPGDVLPNCQTQHPTHSPRNRCHVETAHALWRTSKQRFSMLSSSMRSTCANPKGQRMGLLG
jgi:hypothetical protein